MNINMLDIQEAFKLMGIGMGGIFAVLFIIYIASVGLLKFFPEEK